MRIGVDIDGVIADFVAAFLPELNRICACSRDQIVSHDFRNNVYMDEESYKTLWEDLVDDGRIYEKLVPVGGAQNALRDLAENHEILVISSRSGNSREATEAWLRKYGIPFARLEVGKSKREKVDMMARCDLVLEDELDIARMVAARGVPVILFDYPWNQVGDRIRRVKGWEEAAEEIQRIRGH